MGKRIIQQARGKGSLTYRVRKKAFRYTVEYPMNQGEGKILKILHSPAHSAPLMKIKVGEEVFYNVSFNMAYEGQKISVGGEEIKEGNIVALKDIPNSTEIYNIEKNPGDGGKMIRTAGSSAYVNKKYEGKGIGVMMPNRKELILDENCRASIGVVAGEGRTKKPLMKAGKQFYKKRARGKLWPKMSAVSMNAVDHPFGSGRGKRIKPKIAERNAPPGKKVGHLRPRRTGKKR